MMNHPVIRSKIIWSKYHVLTSREFHDNFDNVEREMIYKQGETTCADFPEMVQNTQLPQTSVS